MKANRLFGIILFIITIFLVYERFDIITEMFSGRPLGQLMIFELLLPLLLLLIGIFLILKKQNNEKDNNNI